MQGYTFCGRPTWGGATSPLVGYLSLSKYNGYVRVMGPVKFLVAYKGYQPLGTKSDYLRLMLIQRLAIITS